ncbi:Fusarisetin A cluster transcription factor fsa6 [Hyphodiscus hymeniophilus]|uniref:Fusarisetin A cluster transcription factor fsa6 n=1 Tax=Hyphodiscus hymeniophilus TaxID=353542 RepID=A0A9P7AW59_9HELO|nr:Fusarisetin A cluster transcription factor fsa6 [Hyphodiscus hymeniophilus]
MASEQPPTLPGPQYHNSVPLPSVAQSQQLPMVSNAQSQALPLSRPETPQQPPTPAATHQVRATPELNRKRARPTVSCFECRRKKLKCDRVQPCSQCVKARREDLCQFATGVMKIGVNRTRPQPLVAAREDDGDRERAGKRMRIEDVMTLNSIPGNGQVEEINGREAYSPGLTTGRIYVKGNRSRYVGVGDRMAMLDQFEDAKSYIMNSFKDPDTIGMMYELSEYHNSFQKKPKKLKVQLPQDRASLISEMMKSIPTDGALGSVFHFYGTHWEGLTRVLHMPTLLQEAKDVEDSLISHTEGNYSLPPNTRESIVPQLIGILILSTRFSKLMIKDASEDQIAMWMELMQRWLDGLKGKEKLNIDTLRVQTLLLLAKMSSLAQTSELWKESGILVRSAMIMGLHQDPESYETISAFEKEQRRKLWRSIVELDVQFSLACGMPAAIRSSDFKSRALRNVDDAALKEQMTTYPDDTPERVWTDALPQFLMDASMKDRLDATNLLTSEINIPNTEKLLSLARYFEYSLQGLSNDLAVSLSPSSERSAGRLFTKIMLDVQLRRPIMSIYQQILFSGNSSHYLEVQRGALRNAIAMLSHLDALDPEVADPNTIKSRDQLNLFHILCKRDIMQAALILCLEIQSFSHASREGERTLHNGRDDLLPWTKTSLTRIVENTLNSLLQRLGEFGSDLKDILPLSIVLLSARSDGTPEDKKALMRKGAERVLKACREALPNLPITRAAFQDRPTSASNTVGNSLAPPSEALDKWPSLGISNKYHGGTPLTSFNLDARPSCGDMSMVSSFDAPNEAIVD